MYSQQDADLEAKSRAALQGIAGDVTILPAGLGAAAGNYIGQEGDNEARYLALKSKLGIQESPQEDMSAFAQGVLDENAKNQAAIVKYPVIENVGLAAGVVGNPAKLLPKGAKIAQEAAEKVAPEVVVNTDEMMRKLAELMRTPKVSKDAVKVTTKVPDIAEALSPTVQRQLSTINNMPGITKEEASKQITNLIEEAYGKRSVNNAMKFRAKK